MESLLEYKDGPLKLDVWVHVILTIYNNPGISITKMAQKAGISLTYAMNTKKSLLQRGLLEGRMNGREKELRLTKKGEEAAKGFLQGVNAVGLNAKWGGR